MITHEGKVLFSRRELECRCGCGRAEFDKGFLYMLRTFRVEAGLPMVVSSGCRCPEHNVKASKTGPDGPHTFGAVDILCYGDRARQWSWLAAELGFTGIGLHQRGPHAQRFLHLDMIQPGGKHPRPWLWTY